MLPPHHVYLSGLRGTGKTSVGKLLAQQWERPFADLDDMIEEAAKMSIREIFEQGGESLFRDWESKCLEAVSQRQQRHVISLGGGAILREENRNLINQSGCCIWLTADAETLVGRISRDETTGERRPALTNLDQISEMRQLLTTRTPLYQTAADHEIDTVGKTPESIAEEISNLLPAD